MTDFPFPLRHFNAFEIINAAFRYYLGRRTASVHSFTKELVTAWPELDQRTRNQITKELEKAFKDDDDCRKDILCSHMNYPLGADYDRAAWEQVRECYSANFQKPKQICKWSFIASQNVWDTTCGEFLDAGGIEISAMKICPHCGKETNL